MSSYYDDLDLQQNQIQNVIIHPVANTAAITSPIAGQFIFDLSDGFGKYYDGSVWVAFPQTGGGGGSDFDYSSLTAITWNSNRDNEPIPAGSGWQVDLSGNNRELTGIVAGTDDQRLLLFNANTKKIKVKHDDANSSVGNRILCPNNGDYDIEDWVSTIFRYSTALGAWTIMSSTLH